MINSLITQFYYMPYICQASKVAQWLRIHLPSRRPGFDPWVMKIPWRRKWQPTPVSLPGKPHGQKSLAKGVHGVARVRHNLATEPPPPNGNTGGNKK